MVFASSNPSLSTQLAAAFPLALAACVSPAAVPVLIYYLGRDSARRLVLAYYGGALVMTYSVGIAGLFVLRELKLDPAHHHGPSAGIDIALGAAMLSVAFVLARRRRTRGTEEKPPRQHKSTATAAALVGLIMWTPSLTYLASIKLVSEAAPKPLTAAWIALLLTLCVLLLVESAIVLYLVFPDTTTARLKAIDTWFARHVRTLLIWLLTIAGSFMLGYGIFRLVHD